MVINGKRYRKIELPNLQSIILDTMKDIHEFCVAHDIQYYCIAGTVLGAVRHGGFIPWDDEIDIAMTRENYERFKMLYAQKCSDKYFLQDYRSDKDFGLALMRVCIKGTYLDWPAQNHLRNCKCAYIDIFPLDNVPVDETLQIKQANQMKFLNKVCHIKLYKVGQTKNDFNFIAKSLLHAVLKFVPIRILVQMKETVMTAYDNKDSECLCSMQSHYNYKKQTFKRSVYGTPTLIRFEDTQFFAPEQFESYLKQLYGNYMELPPIDKRKTNSNAYIIE